ncbi:hypothetical protein H4R24_003860 [Coemansia sp. RSA 988]|nr:hypothetical protein H4R24_003860 [Coemansia sp. RSA 988]
MSSYSFGPVVGSGDHRTRDPLSNPHDMNGARPETAARRVQIQAIPHSTTSADALDQRNDMSRADNRSIRSGSEDSTNTDGLPYGMPSAINGRPLEHRHTAPTSQDVRVSDTDATPEGRKASGLRAALASKFAAKKKPKDFRTTVAVNSKRQQHQLESLMSQDRGDSGKSSLGPMVGGKPVGHPMSFHHVEHLSPTEIAPKMPLINGLQQLNKPMEMPTKVAPTSERRLKFRNFKPASLLTKPSKASLGDSASINAGNGAKGAVTLRGKPIGAPSGFHHVEHMSPTEYSMQQYHLFNHRQQQTEIVSVLQQNNSQAGSNNERRRAPSAAAKNEKITYRGLPLSGPVTFEHVEHMSPNEYKSHLETTVRKESVAAATANVDTLLQPRASADAATPEPDFNANFSTDLDTNFGMDAASAASDSAERSSGDRPHLAALQHTSQTVRPSASDLGMGKPRKMSSAMLKELQASAEQQPQGNSDSNKARAGMIKVKQISSPFNVQHDVHISVEDLDDIMHQVPETWKPYISPARSPESEHRSSEANDTSSQAPQTPIYEEMTSRRRRSTGEGEAMLTQMAHSRFAAPNANGPGLSGPSTPGWLPHIVPVSSPTNQSPSGHRGQRIVSGGSTGALDTTPVRRISHMSAADVMSASVPRASTPVSAPIRRSISGDDNRNAITAYTYDAPDTPQSAAARIVSATEPCANTWIDSRGENEGTHAILREKNSNDSPKYHNANIVEVRKSEGVPVASGAAHAKWIKRKSRAVSTLGTAMLAKHISKTDIPVPTLMHDKRHTLSPDATSVAARAKADAIARLESNAHTPSTIISSIPPTSPGYTMDGELDSKKSAAHSSSSRNGEPRAGTSSGKSSKKRRENYGELEEYAEGESGNVFITTRKSTTGKRTRGEHVAVKVVPKSAKTRYRKLRTELKILRRIRSHHVVRFYEYFSIDDSVWIIYEFMGRGSITDLLAGYPEIRMPAITISYVMHEVLTALAYLHERHIIHCDVRSDNVLIDDKGQVKLADFSSAVYLEPDQTSAQKSSLGAIYWMAPELARGAGYSPSTDAWASGSLLYEMLEGQPPYIEYPDIKVLELSHTNGMPKLSNPDACDPSLVELMHLCTAITPSDRPPAARLRKHESVISQDSTQCAKLMIDFVLQVESLEVDEEDDADSAVAP